MKDARSRFMQRASLIGVSLLAALLTVVAVVAAFVTRGSEASIRTIIIVMFGALLLAVGLAGGPILGALALRRLRRLHPYSLVFLAKREPVLAPDIQLYQYRKDNFADIGDKWVPTLVDGRGVSVWSAWIRPKEQLLMNWSELGDITACSFESISGKSLRGVTVDVRPFPTPLRVRVGYAAFGFEGSFDAVGIAALTEEANGRRPGS